MKIGDVFSVELDNQSKKFFQYIANDITQLNSEVIRAFKKSYSISAPPLLTEIIKDEVDFYAHVVTKMGVKMKLWKKAGNVNDVGELEQIIFRHTNDYGTKMGEKPIEISNQWFIWKINDASFTTIGSLKNVKEKTYIGLVFNPYGIIELLKGNSYPVTYPK